MLEREEPTFVGTRLARGDKGIDAISVLDAASGEVSAFQAKLCNKIDKAKQEEILVGFLKVMSNPLKCVRWTLLVPITLSTDELTWLYSHLCSDAIGRTSDQKIQYKISNCEIHHLGESDLLRRLGRNRDVAMKFLPTSKESLKAQLQDEKDKLADLNRDLMDRLRSVQDGQIRDRLIQHRNACAAIKMLNQGWSDELEMLHSKAREKNLVGLEEAARSLGEFTSRIFDRAILIEGLVPGASESVMKIHAESRALIQYAIIQQYQKPQGDGEHQSPHESDSATEGINAFSSAFTLYENARSFTRDLGKVMRAITVGTLS